jgi:VWFA-related protein
MPINAVTVLFSIAALVLLQQQQPIRSGIDLVHFSVVVTDKEGQPVQGLKAEDFELRERGKAQRISYFAAGDTAISPPLHLGLLLDNSGSMDPESRDVRTAVIKFLNQNAHAVDVTLVDFDTEVRMSRYGPNDYPRLIERIRGRRPDGWTAFYDALSAYLTGTFEQDGQKVLLVYTDGGDTRSSMRASEVMDMLKSCDVTVYVIGYLEHQSSTARNNAMMELQRFAAVTGGQALFPTSLKDVEKMYEKIQRELSARYTLGFTSTDEKADGTWRDVDIKLTRPDIKSAKIRTRSGYYAAFREGSK